MRLFSTGILFSFLPQITQCYQKKKKKKSSFWGMNFTCWDRLLWLNSLVSDLEGSQSAHWSQTCHRLFVSMWQRLVSHISLHLALHPTLLLSPSSLLQPYIFSHLISLTGNKFRLLQPLYLFIYRPLRAVKNPWDTPHYKASSISGLLRFESLVNRIDSHDSMTAEALHISQLPRGGDKSTQRSLFCAN